VSPPLLAARGLAAGYDGHPVVRDLDLIVQRGQIAALLGPNGAGKTTTLLALAGWLRPLAGELRIDGRPAPVPLHRRARDGMSLVTEERSIFTTLTVAENLRVGRCREPAALALFPELEPLLGRRAGLLSGGEQRMLALARALGRSPRLVLADELSLGLAPRLVARLLDALRDAADQRGTGVLIVEQHARQALRVADHAYVLERGGVVASGSADEVSYNPGGWRTA
jgi:branched-chain amino acid transport system ATP-binding protein